MWSRAFGGPYADLAPGLAVDEAGSVYATGTFVQRIDFGGGVLTGDAAYGDGFLVRLMP